MKSPIKDSKKRLFVIRNFSEEVYNLLMSKEITHIRNIIIDKNPLLVPLVNNVLENFIKQYIIFFIMDLKDDLFLYELCPDSYTILKLLKQDEKIFSNFNKKVENDNYFGQEYFAEEVSSDQVFDPDLLYKNYHDDLENTTKKNTINDFFVFRNNYFLRYKTRIIANSSCIFNYEKLRKKMIIKI